MEQGIGGELGNAGDSDRPHGLAPPAGASTNEDRDTGSPPGRWWTSGRPRLLGVCGLLLLAVGLALGQTAGFEFVSYDNFMIIRDCPLVSGKVDLSTVRDVFSGRELENFGPLSCLSHTFVWHVLGHGAGVHHLTNVLLHAAAALVLLLALYQMTGRLWPSALVAVVFAVHPLRVESVVWVTERKDVLSGLFFALALWAYVQYALRSPPLATPRKRGVAARVAWYLTVMALFVLCIGAKPNVVVLPFVLLLLDYWPLGRLRIGQPAPVRNVVLSETVLPWKGTVPFLLTQKSGQPPSRMRRPRRPVQDGFPPPFAW